MKKYLSCLAPSAFRHILPLSLVLIMTSCQSSLFASHVTPAPTPQCVEPTLTLGTTIFRVDTVTREQDNPPEIPRSKKNVAFWVEGTTVNYVFALSPTKDNQALGTILKAGDPAVINWADCNTDEYVVKSIDTIPASDLTLFSQSSGGITVYIQDQSSTLVIRGERPVVQPAETSEPSIETVQVDISILDMIESDDHQSVTFNFLITNQGAQAITLTDNDISMTVENSPEVFPTLTTPTLPQEMRPGDIIPIHATFPKPQAPSAVLKVFDTTFEYYFQ